MPADLSSDLSRSQLLIWTGQGLHPEAPLYNMVLTFEIDGAIDKDRFAQAVQAVVDGSDALRSRFREVDGIPRRETVEVARARHEFVDRSTNSASGACEDDEQFEAWIDAQAREMHELETCAYRSILIKRGPTRHVWFLNQHHLIADAWSTALILERVREIYESLASEKGRVERAVSPPFEDYVRFERDQVASPAHEKAVAYWENQLAAPSQPTQFYGRARSTRSPRTERVTCRLDRARSRKLRDFARRADVRGLTPEISQFHVFAAALYALVHRVGGLHDDLTILTPVHGRPTAAFKRTVGLFIEVFPMPLHLAPDATFTELLSSARRAYQDLLVHARPGASTPATARSYDVLLNYIPSKFGDEFAGMPMKTEWVHARHGDPAHSLRLQVHDFEGTGEFALHFDFNCDVFGHAERDATKRHYVKLLDAMLADPAQKLREIDLLEPAERRARIVDFNETSRDFEDRTILQAFERHVLATPDRTAIRCDGREMSYRELDRRSNQCAHVLRDRGVDRGARIAIMLERSPDFVVSVLAAFKVGAAYVPVEPSYPSDRIAFMLADCGALVLVTNTESNVRLADSDAARTARAGLRVVDVDRDEAEIAAMPTTALDPSLDADDLAYVIYTSGSTGRPKGVKVSHGALANYACWARETYTNGRADDFAFFSPVSVDLGVTSLFVPLISGSAISIYAASEASHDLSVLRVFDDDAVDIVKLTPAHLSLLLERGDFRVSRIRTLIVGGEDLTHRLALRVRDALGARVALYNEYGPTEATVGCMIHRFDDESDAESSVPIGRPIANAQIYVLDDRMQPTPEGVPGEIWIGGRGVADGYVGDTELTDQRFVVDPFRPSESGRLYRSGDLGRVIPSTGDIVYCGRIDDQVKIRGARVEVAEVQASLETHPEIAACVVDVAHREATSIADSTPDPRWLNLRYCVRCGLASNHPEAHLDDTETCAICRAYEGYRDEAQAYFKTMADLDALFARAREERLERATPEPQHDCLMLLSGGKDSTFALYQLVELGLRPLVFSLDNGFISDSAKANIRRVVDDLGLELVFAQTPSMNAIFADSLDRFSNVCQGCFKTIYTLSTKLAMERGIRHIVTGLSRGQIFETRLAGFFRSGIHDVEEIDKMIIEARKVYHRVDDAVARQLDVSQFASDEIFEQVQFVDFYRYCDVPLREMLSFINTRAAWIRPEDTGRSTNCLINDTGIFVHKRERGYHNYALPYSWDVRLGHKTRDECLAELDDEIDEDKVRHTLREVGSDKILDRDAVSDKHLVAYYVTESSERTVRPSDLRDYLAQRLPAYMIPSSFVAVPTIPLTATGKVDREALTRTARTPARDLTAPRTDDERVLVSIWKDVLGLESVGIYEDFLDLGGDSILNIQIVSRARTAGLRLTPRDVFAHPTIAKLAAVVARIDSPGVRNDAPVTGAVPRTPIQDWFFEKNFVDPQHFGQSYVLEFTNGADAVALEAALRAVIRHHDALRLRFPAGADDAFLADPELCPGAADEFVVVVPHDSTDVTPIDLSERLRLAEDDLHRGFDIARGPLLRAALLRGASDGKDLLVLAAHHLAIDAVSWGPLLEDLDAAYGSACRRESIVLPSKTTSWKDWAVRLVDRRAAALSDLGHWTKDDTLSLTTGDSPRAPTGRRVSEEEFTYTCTENETRAVLDSSTPTHELLLAALVNAVSQWRASDRSLRVDLEGHGREAPYRDAGADATIDVSRTVGWFMTLYPVWLQPHADALLHLRHVREQLSLVPEGGHGYGLLRYGSPTTAAHEKLSRQPAATILFNYLGRSQAIHTGMKNFRCLRGLAVSRSPHGQRTHALEVFGAIERGRLAIHFAYNGKAHDAASIEDLAVLVNGTLQELAVLDAGATPSDFPHADVSQSELDDIFDEFGGEV